MKNIKKFILLIFVPSLITPCFSYNIEQSCTYLFAGNTDILKPYDDALVYDGTKRVKELTQFFCDKVQPMKCSDTSDGSYATDYFDASQSIFLSILCESVGVGQGYRGTNSYLKKNDFLGFGIVSSETGYHEDCHWYGSMNNCNYSYNLPLIFNKIINDFFSIKQARNMGIFSIEDSFDSEVAANKFSIENFPGLNLQEGLTNGICDPDSKYYKTTCKKLKGYMKDANNLLKNTEIVDVVLLQGEGEEADCENEFSKNILYCGLLGSDSTYKYINTVYNEYLWYKLFLSYYSFYIDGYDYLDSGKGDIDSLQENKEKIYLTQDQLLKSKQAITLSLRSLGDISNSFPLHIGFLMYHEDAKYFIENISKIYAPIRTLYDKLRNVQIKES